MNKLLWSMGISVALGSAVVTGASAQQLGLDEGWSMGGQALVGGESADFTRTFNAGTRYEIVANGSENAQDIDLEILDSRGRLIRQDIRSAKEASVTFSPAYSGRYTIRLKMARASGRALAYFIVFLEDGRNAPMSRVTAAFSRLAAVTSLAQLVDYQRARTLSEQIQGGAPKDEALRKAQRAVRKSESFSDPYFWSGFVLIGDYQNKFAAPRSRRASETTVPLLTRYNSFRWRFRSTKRALRSSICRRARMCSTIRARSWDAISACWRCVPKPSDLNAPSKCWN